MKNKIILGIIIFILIGAIPRFYNALKDFNLKEEKFKAYYNKASYDNKIPDIELNGELKPYYNVEIYSKIDGILEKRYVNIGDKVKKGDLLAVISAPLIDAELIAAQKAVVEAEYKLNFAKNTYERYKNSFKDGAIAPQEMQNKETDYNTAQMEYKIAKANLKRAAEMKNYEYIKAPFDGVVTKYNFDLGANIVAGGNSTSTMLFEVSQIEKLRLRIDIPQSYIDRIKLNQKISFYIPENPNEKFEGTLSKLSKSFDSLTRTMKAEIFVDNKDLKLFCGQYVKINIPFESNNKMLLVKNSSLITDKNGSRVLIVDDNNVLHYKKVEIGKEFKDVIEIKQGLKENDKVVVNLTDGLKEGQEVFSQEE